MPEFYGTVSHRGVWRPQAARLSYGLPEVGQLLAIAFEAWRVVDVIESDDRHDVIVRRESDGEKGKRRGVRVPKGTRKPQWYVLPEHYAICRTCEQVPPCRDEWAASVADDVAKEQARYDMPGICPACREPVTSRQQSVTMLNVIVPLGADVTFHRRSRCIASAVQYEQRLCAQTGDRLKLSCSGFQVQHLDGLQECAEPECPDPAVHHRGFAMCYVSNVPCVRPECTEATRQAAAARSKKQETRP